MKQSNALNKLGLGACVAVLILFFFPYLYLGQDAYINIHDNLDSDVAWLGIVAKSGKTFAISNEVKIESVMNGLNRNSFPSSYNFTTLLFYLFKPYTAYFLNFFLKHLAAFFGMFLLLKDFVFRSKEESVYLYGISLAFALNIFWGSTFGIAVSGLPLMAWCFAHLLQRTHAPYHYFLIIFFSFFSSLVFIGLFLLIVLGIIYLYYVIRHKDLHYQFVLGIVLLSFAYVIADANLIMQFLFDNQVYHRVEYTHPGWSLGNSLKEFIDVFLYGHYHASSANTPFILIIAIIGIGLGIYGMYQLQNGLRRYRTFTLVSFAAIVLAAGIHGFWNYEGFIPLKSSIKLLTIIQWNRFIWLNPMLWYLLFALSIKLINELKPAYRWLKVASVLIIIIQIGFLLNQHNEFKANLMKVIGSWRLDEKILGREVYFYPIDNAEQKISFRQFFDEALFQEIEDHIGLPQNQYRVISLGIFPDITTFNGFYSLDSYQRIYLLEYKHEFREIIEPELNKSDELKKYFDSWGNRCYIYSAELGRNFQYRYDSDVVVEHLDLNVDKLKQMGAQYIISAVEVNTENQPWLKLGKVFHREDSYWKIYLYKIL